MEHIQYKENTMSQFVNPGVVMQSDRKLDDRELLRAIRQGIAAEHEATHLYEFIADATDNEKVKKVMQDVAKEEKVHVHEFQALLDELDVEEEDAQEQAADEINELSGTETEEVDELSGEVSESAEVIIDGERILLEKGDSISIKSK